MTTTLVINGKKQDWEPKDASTVLSVLMEAQTKLWKPDVSIQSVAVNGAPISDLTETTLGSIPGSDVTIDIKLAEASQKRTLKTTIADARNYLTRLKEGFEQLANNLRTEPTKEDFENLSHSMLGLATVFELFETLLSYDSLTDEIKENCKTFIGSFQERISELTEAQENEDYILIADILEYECMDGTEELEVLLEQLSSQMPEA